jgi:sporulation protein YlmC with PRC-barrel domain
VTQVGDPKNWTGKRMLDRDGKKLGTVADIYMDEETHLPEWALVRTGLLGKKESFVPLADASVKDDELRVPYEKDQVKDAPSVDPDGELTTEEEIRLYEHYDLAYSRSASGSVLAEGMGGTAGGEREGAGGGRGEEPSAGDEEVSGAGAAPASAGEQRQVRPPSELKRLKKYVVTEEQQITVPVTREEYRMEDEPPPEGATQEASDAPGGREGSR